MAKSSRFLACSMAARLSLRKQMSRHLAKKKFTKSTLDSRCRLTLILIPIYDGVRVMDASSMLGKEAGGIRLPGVNAGRKSVCDVEQLLMEMLSVTMWMTSSSMNG